MADLDELLSRANMCHAAGQWSEAVRLYTQALAEVPENGDLWFLLGTAQFGMGRVDEATTSLQRSVDISPDRAEFHHALGAALASEGKHDEAIARLREALRLKPERTETTTILQQTLAARENTRGLELTQQGRTEAAVACYRAALEFASDDAVAHGNLASALCEQEKLDEAIECYRRLIDLQPQTAGAYFSLAVALRRQNQLDDAIAAFRHACELQPDYVEAHVGLGMALLSAGRLEEGWAEYEWRLRRENAEPSLPRPRWSGTPLDQKTILLVGEQGFGDNIQFIRYAEHVKRLGARVVVGCKPPLGRLFSRLPLVDQFVAPGEALPQFDFHASLLSLPAIFHTTLASAPARVPYLVPDQELVRNWQEELQNADGLKIGIAWQGSPTQLGDRRRSFALENFADIAARNDVRLYSLQFGPGREQLAGISSRWPITDLGDRLGDFDNVAAIMCNLDLIITCDSAPAHLAGALGLPVWVALPFAADWRWLLDRVDSPWYPTMRLFRQSQPGDWRGVFDEIAIALAARH